MSTRRVMRLAIASLMVLPQVLPAQRQVDALRGLPDRSRIRFVTTDGTRDEGWLRHRGADTLLIELADGRRRPLVAASIDSLWRGTTNGRAETGLGGMVGAFAGGVGFYAMGRQFFDGSDARRDAFVAGLVGAALGALIGAGLGASLSTLSPTWTLVIP